MTVLAQVSLLPLLSASHLFFSHFSATDRRRCRRRHEPRVRALVIPFPFLRHTAAVVTLSALDNNEEWGERAASRMA